MPIKLPHSVIVKSPGLLPMLYKVSELSEELDIPDRTLRDWLSFGAPYQKDSNQHVWINGKAFSSWVAEQRKTKTSRGMTESEAWCLKCKKAVEMKDVHECFLNGKPRRLRGECPICGRIVNRGVKRND